MYEIRISIKSKSFRPQTKQLGKKENIIQLIPLSSNETKWVPSRSLSFDSSNVQYSMRGVLKCSPFFSLQCLFTLSRSPITNFIDCNTFHMEIDRNKWKGRLYARLITYAGFFFRTWTIRAIKNITFNERIILAGNFVNGFKSKCDLELLVSLYC